MSDQPSITFDTLRSIIKGLRQGCDDSLEKSGLSLSAKRLVMTGHESALQSLEEVLRRKEAAA